VLEISVERNWTEIFQIVKIDKACHLNIEHGQCDSACLQAKELKCVCRCGGRNHGAAVKQNVRSLDEFEEDPVVFDQDEYLQEPAALW
jgi:hypothetical protein